MHESAIITQHAKKVVSDSPGLVDFAIRLVSSVINLPDGQVKYGTNMVFCYGTSSLKRYMQSRFPVGVVLDL